MAERRHLGSNAPSTTTLGAGESNGGSAPAPKAPNADGEKHYSHARINEVTKAEQNQCAVAAICTGQKTAPTDGFIACSGQVKNFSLLSLIGLAYCIL